MRWRERLAPRRRLLGLFRLRTEGLRYSRHDLRSPPHSSGGLVYGHLAYDQPEVWDQRSGLTAIAGSGQLAWTMLRKLRSARVRPAREKLSGTVEGEETYVGGIEQGKQGRGRERKFIVAIAIELLDPKGFGRVRLRRVEDVSSARLVPFVQYAVEPGSQVRTDGGNGDKGLSQQNYHHRPVNLSATGNPARVVLPGVHTVASLLKRWLRGTHQGSVTATHLDAYLDEFALRFNRR